MIDRLVKECRRMGATAVTERSGYSRSQIYAWRRELRERQPRARKRFAQQSVENAVGVIMAFPQFGGRKGQAYMIYHRLGWLSMHAYDQIKKAVGRLLVQELLARKLLPAVSSYEHIRPQAPGEIWAEDFTEIRVEGRTFKLAVLTDVAIDFILGCEVSERATERLVAAPVEQALALQQGRGPSLFLLSDNGSVYISEGHHQLLESSEIVQRRIPACTPQYNGAVEGAQGRFKAVFYNRWAQRRKRQANKEKSLVAQVRATVRETQGILNEEIPRPFLGGVTPNDARTGVALAKIEANRRYCQEEKARPHPPPWKKPFWETVRTAMHLPDQSDLEVNIKSCFFSRKPLRNITRHIMGGVG